MFINLFSEIKRVHTRVRNELLLPKPSFEGRHGTLPAQLNGDSSLDGPTLDGFRVEKRKAETSTTCVNEKLIENGKLMHKSPPDSSNLWPATANYNS